MFCLCVPACLDALSVLFGCFLFVCDCVRACGRACLRVTACGRACVRACVRECVRACLRACVRACVHACVRVSSIHMSSCSIASLIMIV